MTKREKREQVMRRNPAQVRFEQLHDLLVVAGFTYNIRGSHYHYEHTRQTNIHCTVVKPHGSLKHVLPVYVKEALVALDESREQSAE